MLYCIKNQFFSHEKNHKNAIIEIIVCIKLSLGVITLYVTLFKFVLLKTFFKILKHIVDNKIIIHLCETEKKLWRLIHIDTYVVQNNIINMHNIFKEF